MPRPGRPSPLSFLSPLLLLVLAAGCTNANRPLNSLSVALESRKHNATRAATFGRLAPMGQGGEASLRSRPEIVPPADLAARPPPDADGRFVGLALSGGGSRSANFAAACMFQLQRVGVLRRVDYLSTVSGGSLAGAYYCVSGDDWNPGNVQRKLSYSFASDLIGGVVFSPWNWAAFAFTDYDRSDVLAASFQRVLFSRGTRALTFADLRPDRPRLLMNATDLQSGRRFVFCNESFDELNADLAKYPIADAVAASSAVPVVLHPVTLRDYSNAFGQYRHLIDGGITDNLGITSLVETYAAHLSAAKARGEPDPYPNGATFIVIDAHTRFDAKLSDKGDFGLVESLKTATGLTSTALLNRASSATLADIIVHNTLDSATARELREQIDRLNHDGYLTLTDRTGHTVHVVYLSLSQVNDLTDLPFESFSESVNSIATYFNIEPTEAYHLYQAADLLFRGKFEPKLRDLVREWDSGEAQPGVAAATSGPATRPDDR